MVRLWAYLNQTLFQIIDVAYVLQIHPLLKTPTNFVVGPGCCMARDQAI